MSFRNVPFVIPALQRMEQRATLVSLIEDGYLCEHESFKQYMTMERKKGYKLYPDSSDYIKLFLVMFLPVIGPVWALIKGLIRAFGKIIAYNVPSSRSFYTSDKRYKSGQRYTGSVTVNRKVYELKSESPVEDVNRFHKHAYIYIAIALVALLLQFASYAAIKRRIAANEERERSYTHWNTITTQDESSGAYSFYDMVYSVVDGKPNSDVVIIKKEGAYYLLVGSSYLVETRTIDRYDLNIGEAEVDFQTDNLAEKITLSYRDKSYQEQTYLLTEGCENHYSYVFLFPRNILPSEGIIRIKLKDVWYSFNLTPTTHD